MYNRGILQSYCTDATLRIPPFSDMNLLGSPASRGEQHSQQWWSENGGRDSHKHDEGISRLGHNLRLQPDQSNNEGYFSPRHHSYSHWEDTSSRRPWGAFHTDTASNTIPTMSSKPRMKGTTIPATSDNQ